MTAECRMSLGPLGGVKILDMTRILAGPFCTMILGDLGADVVKIERPGHGDDTRSWRPPSVGAESAYFLALNRNKRSLTLNLQSTKGRDIARQLAAQSDVVVENFIPGTMERLGLGWEELRRGHGGLIFASLSGFGPDGPWAKRGDYDVIASAIGGLMNMTGSAGGEPAKAGVAVTDIMTGLYTHGAIMAALLQRQQNGGQGQKIDANLLSTQIATLVNIGSNFLNGGKEAQRWGTAHESIVPYQAFKTKDEHWLVVGAGNDKQFDELCQHISLSELLQDTRFSNNASRVEHRNVLIPILMKRFSEEPCEVWETTLERSSLPVGRVNDMSSAFAHPQVLHNKCVESIQHPSAGSIRVTGPAVRFSSSRNEIRLPPPSLGQHSAEILKERLGISPTELDVLRAEGVV